jgi:hypothetical protein
MTNEKPIWTVYLFTVKKMFFFFERIPKTLDCSAACRVHIFISNTVFVIFSCGGPIIGFYPC